jgi:hypothetical protein
MHLAAGSAVRTDGADFRNGRMPVERMPIDNRACRTRIDTCAATHAIALAKRNLTRRPNLGSIAAIPRAPHKSPGYLAANTHASQAMNAA